MKSPETEWANRCAGAPSEVSAEPSWEQVVVNTAKRMGQLLRWERDDSAVRHMNDLDLELPESLSLIGCKITISAT